MSTNVKTGQILHQAAADMLVMSEETSFSDLSSIYLENARLLRLAGEAVDALELEVLVLRAELAATADRATENAACARSWFDRHEALVARQASEIAA